MKMNNGNDKHLKTGAWIAACVWMQAGMLVGAPIVVNSLEDVEVPAVGKVTLRSALAMAASGEPIVFDSTLNGSSIDVLIAS
jgi:hypothetical protein